MKEIILDTETTGLEVKDGQEIIAGDPIVEGPRDPKELLEIRGMRETQRYLVEQVQGVYRDQGVSIHDKHIELIVRQMTRRVLVHDAGESSFLPGESIDGRVYVEANRKLVEEGKEPATEPNLSEILQELNLDKAQSIYGYFDKSSLIELIKNLFSGDEKKVFELYRKIYDSGVDPKIFLNDFLEVLYYLKNINFIKLDGNNFSLNDQDFSNLSIISENLDPKDIILFWQFTLDTIEEINIVSNPYLSVEMFLFRLMRIKGFKEKDVEESFTGKNPDTLIKEPEKKIISKTIDQIKNISQQEKIEPNLNKDEVINELKIGSFESLINLCSERKEAKLKYELETNTNLVSFSEGLIEISFNENLDKEFIKNLSNKLYEWTSKRWIISLSKNQGQISKKEKNKIDEKKIFDDVKKSEAYKKVIEAFPDAELINVELKED